MNEMNRNDVVTGPALTRSSFYDRIRVLVGTGLIATVVAMMVTTVAAAIAKAVGVDYELPDGGETVPLSGFAVMTGIFSVVGIMIAAAVLRWSAHPRERFVKVAVTLTAISLVPPFLADANAGTIAGLVLLHLAAAAVMIPALARGLRTGRAHPHQH